MVTNNSINKSSDTLATLTEITGSNSNKVLDFTDVSSAVNYISVSNNITGSGPLITPGGSDTDIDITVESANAGNVILSGSVVTINNTGDTSAGASLQLSEASDNGTNAVIFQAPASLSASTTYTLPDSSTDGYLTNTSGTLSWQTSSSNDAIKAWASFDGSTVTLQDSFNVTSVTRVAAGQYTVNFTNALSSAVFTTQVTATRNGAIDAYVLDTIAATTSTISVGTCGNNNTAADAIQINVTVLQA